MDDSSMRIVEGDVTTNNSQSGVRGTCSTCVTRVNCVPCATCVTRVTCATCVNRRTCMTCATHVNRVNRLCEGADRYIDEIFKPTRQGRYAELARRSRVCYECGAELSDGEPYVYLGRWIFCLKCVDENTFEE